MSDNRSKTLIVIPARYASTRYPAKPLVELTGATGQAKTLIQRSWEAACAVQGVDRVIVATDDDRIRTVAEGFGAEVMMTPVSCANGTERCSYVAKELPGYDIVVNLQGDAPLTPAIFVEDLIAAMDDSNVLVATPVLRCDAQALKDFLNDRQHGRVGGTTVVFSRAMNALYFSKEVIPYTGTAAFKNDQVPVFHHVGVYAYRREALAMYDELEVGTAESYEGLEQLRFLENSVPVRCVEMTPGPKFWELNNPSDVAIIEDMMKVQGIA
jgi:3-deoxy-manno-octulosonate cytidylyltransferase (CMP-KDO synthetase)